MKSALLTSLASHGHRRTDSAAPWGATLLIRIACNRILKGIDHETEEQGSDVNLGAHLLIDGFLNRYDAAIVITGDSDLVTLIQMA